MNAIARKGLVQALRSRVSDDRATVEAFSLGATGECKSALLEITNGFLVVTVEGGNSVRGIRFNLNDPKYNTVGRLIKELSRQRGYTCTESTLRAQANYPSLGLRSETGITEIANGEGHTLRHHIFSDEELNEYLTEAVTLHNPNYRVNTIPSAEHAYVLMKAQARCYRTLASDSARRRGLDTDAKIFLALAHDLEGQYDKEAKRMARIIPSAKIDESKIGTGDFIQGSLSRRSLRSGFTAPHRTKVSIDPPVLLDLSDSDIEDVNIFLRWNKSTDDGFAYYELWRDTQSNVERGESGRLESSPSGPATPFRPATTQFSRGGTSIQVMGLSGNTHLTGRLTTEFSQGGSGFTSFFDGIVQPTPGSGNANSVGLPLEPEMDYYYRLYGVDRNGEILPSRVLHVRTKSIRARFARTSSGTIDASAISPNTGVIAGGTTLTITGTAMGEGTYLTLAGKRCVEVSRTLTSLVVTTPGMTNTDSTGVVQDLVLVSTNGLRDIAKHGFTYS